MSSCKTNKHVFHFYMIQNNIEILKTTLYCKYCKSILDKKACEAISIYRLL